MNMRDFVSLPAAELSSRMRKRSGRLLRWLRRQIELRWKFAAPKLRDPPGRSAQDNLQSASEYHKYISQEYRPGPYDGTLTFFRVTRRNNHAGWRDLVGRDLTIVELPVQTRDTGDPHLVEEPYVQSLADALKRSLHGLADV